MNQEQNNFNQNSFNMQGNNGMPNNQLLDNFNSSPNINQPIFNSQLQATPSYQQSINQTNMQETVQQPINNTFESGNGNNQSFNSKPPKKMKLGLIIGIVVAVVVVGVGVVFGSKLLSNGGSNNNLNSNSNVEQNENKPSNENDKQNNSKILKASEYFDTTKFDKTKYDGLLYKDGNSYQVIDILNEELNIGYDNMLFYTFSDNSLEEKASFKFGGDTGVANSDTYIQIILDELGHPSTYMESYNESGYGYTGSFELLYNYGDYMIVFLGADYRNWKDYDYKYPMLISCYITTNIDKELEAVSRSEYTVYGE